MICVMPVRGHTSKNEQHNLGVNACLLNGYIGTPCDAHKPLLSRTRTLTTTVLGSQMLVDLGQDVYQEEYERHLLAEAVTWYRLEAAEFVAASSCPDYLRKVRPRRLNGH